MQQPPPAATGALDPRSLEDHQLRRFPWPADPAQRFGLASPWLAVVNARGPWGVWGHWRERPRWLPFCESLWDKPFWREADNATRVVWWALVWRAANESYWGVISWGEPLRLAYELCQIPGIEPQMVGKALGWLLSRGALVYLTNAEKLALEAWKPARQPGGGRGGRQVGAQRQTGTETGDRDRREGQSSGSQARAHTLGSSGSAPGESAGTGTGTETATATEAQGQRDPQTQPQGTGHSRHRDKPANLTDSDREGGRTRAGAQPPGRGRRPPSDSGEAVPIGPAAGQLVHWRDPIAQQFARRMFRAITLREPPPDAFAATEDDRSVLGAWASQWVKSFSRSVSGSEFEAFCARCERDIARKRGKRGVTNLGGLAMSKIVPGIVAAMGKRA